MRIDENLGQELKTNVSKILEKLREHDLKFNLNEKRFEKIDRRFDKVELRLDTIGDYLHKLGIDFEDFKKDQKLILEIVLSNQEELKKIGPLEKSVSNHENRISAVEHFVKKHPN